MKNYTLRRFLATLLLTLVMTALICLSVFECVCPAGSLDFYTEVLEKLNAMFHASAETALAIPAFVYKLSDLQYRLIAGGKALILIILLMQFIAASTRRAEELSNREEEVTGVTQKTENGDISVSFVTVRALIDSCLRRYPACQPVSVDLSLDDRSNVNIAIDLTVAEGVCIPDTVSALQKSVKRYVSDVAGIGVGLVSIDVSAVRKPEEGGKRGFGRRKRIYRADLEDESVYATGDTLAPDEPMTPPEAPAAEEAAPAPEAIDIAETAPAPEAPAVEEATPAPEAIVIEETVPAPEAPVAEESEPAPEAPAEEAAPAPEASQEEDCPPEKKERGRFGHRKKH